MPEEIPGTYSNIVSGSNKKTGIGQQIETALNVKLGGINEKLDIGEDTGAFWIPPTQPDMPWGANGVPTDKDPEAFVNNPVSYTHLTLPTICSV